MTDAMSVYDKVQEAIREFCEFQDARGIPRETQRGFILAVFDNQGAPFWKDEN